ncbi:tRNA lysidine(34) synthetase TilS [Haloimpatiens sp. FM7315]|uniref:tRNA lysidine(34) synthetase TilS n=1 Tax=Haloimpatiens sp. FM7315 TaxID=3298609 RepID=UPI00370A304D
MINKIVDTIEKYHMFEAGDKVIVAVSGGPDSICLLNVLYNLKDNYNIKLVAAHLNHCLRGEEADKDENYVKDYCIKKGIEFYSKSVDINKKALEENVSSETAGRDARYEFFNELKERLNAQKIAVAHNANDQAETVMMRLMRGTGLKGLKGIRPVRDKIFVRPLISVNRKEIEKYCEDNSLEPRIDKTNLENIYSRNKIRLELLPYIEKNFNEDIINTLNRFSCMISKDNDYIEKMADIKYKKHCHDNCGKIIIESHLFQEEEAIVTRVIRRALLFVKGDLHNLDMKHVYEIIELQKKPTGKYISLPEDIIAFNNYKEIHIYIKEKNILDQNKRVSVIEIGKEKHIKELNMYLNCEVLDYSFQDQIKSSKFTKYFDMQKVEGSITYRHRRDGDRFNPLGMKGSRKLKDLFIDLKIPREDRNKIPLICFGDDIAWIVGFRVSDKFKVDKNTKKILKVEFKEGVKTDD